MARSSVRFSERVVRPTRPDRQPTEARRATSAEVLSPVEHLQQRFDDAFDRADELGALIRARRERGLDCVTLLKRLSDAEADKMAALAALRKVRWMKGIPTA